MRAAFSIPETGDSKRRSLDIDHHNNRTIICESENIVAKGRLFCDPHFHCCFYMNMNSALCFYSVFPVKFNVFPDSLSAVYIINPVRKKVCIFAHRIHIQRILRIKEGNK